MKPVWKRTACVACILSFCGVFLTSGSAQTLTGVDGSASVTLEGIYEPLEEGDTVYSVTVTWGDLEYTYSEGANGTWDPSTHTYQNGTSSGWDWEEESNKIAATNHSNAAVDIFLEATTKGNVEGGFYSQTKGGTETAENTLHLDTAVGTTVENAPTEETYYQITGGSIQESGPIGSITITLQGADSGTEKPSVPSAGEVAATFQVSGSSDRSVSLYTTETENVYRTELLSDYVYLNGSIPITIDGTEYYVGGKINNSYQSIALSTSLSSTNYITMNGLDFYLEVNLNDWTISTVQS